jgi:hypothetical protein
MIEAVTPSAPRGQVPASKLGQSIDRIGIAGMTRAGKLEGHGMR